MTMQVAGGWWVLPAVGGILAISAVLILTRLLKGPLGPDRVVAIDALTLLGVAAVSIGALITKQAVFIDVAVVLALVSFLSTVGFSLLFRKDDDAARGPLEGGGDKGPANEEGKGQ